MAGISVQLHNSALHGQLEMDLGGNLLVRVSPHSSQACFHPHLQEDS